MIMNITNPTDLIQARANSVQVKDADDDTIKPLLRRIFYYIDLKEEYLPDNTETTSIINYLRLHKSKYTLVDFESAFLLGIQGKLLAENEKGKLKPINMDHYQKFSPRYIEKVINAYDEYLKEHIQKQQKQEPKQIEASHKVTIQDRINNHVNAYKRFLERKDFFDVGGQLFKRLYGSGLLMNNDNEVINKSDFDRVFEKHKMDSKKDDGSLNSFLNKALDKNRDVDDHNALTEAKKEFILQHFRQLRLNEYSIEDYRQFLNENLKNV